MTTTTLDTVARRAGGPTLRRVLASELLKLRGLRSTIVLLLVAVASVVLLGPINAVGQVVEDEPVHGVGDALSLVLMGASNAAILLGVLGSPHGDQRVRLRQRARHLHSGASPR